jgi:hypothetical protein
MSRFKGSGNSTILWRSCGESCGESHGFFHDHQRHDRGNIARLRAALLLRPATRVWRRRDRSRPEPGRLAWPNAVRRVPATASRGCTHRRLGVASRDRNYPLGPRHHRLPQQHLWRNTAQHSLCTDINEYACVNECTEGNRGILSERRRLQTSSTAPAARASTASLAPTATSVQPERDPCPVRTEARGRARRAHICSGTTRRRIALTVQRGNRRVATARCAGQATRRPKAAGNTDNCHTNTAGSFSCHATVATPALRRVAVAALILRR